MIQVFVDCGVNFNLSQGNFLIPALQKLPSKTCRQQPRFALAVLFTNPKTIIFGQHLQFMVAPNTPYIEREFQVFIAAQFGTMATPSPTLLAIMRRVFFAGAQSIYIGLHQEGSLPETEFVDEVGTEIGNFVLSVKANNGK